jgi:hypothetical protein
MPEATGFCIGKIQRLELTEQKRKRLQPSILIGLNENSREQWRQEPVMIQAINLFIGEQP